MGELTQLTFPAENEAQLVQKYRHGYHHGTDDMDPCYLPDGDIVLISTRCQYGILCDPRDIFTTTVLYRMDRDAPLELRRTGQHLTKLSDSSVSEASPTMLPDGRILYTRWEYLDKGAVSVKCLWAMKPDGSGSVEIYGSNIALPPTLIYGRPIPGEINQYVVLGAPHFPQNAMGTVIRLDMSKKSIRTRGPMSLVTADTDFRCQGHHRFDQAGFWFHTEKDWVYDRSGKAGRLFKEPYPLADDLFLVSYKAPGPGWSAPNAYDLAVLDGQGNATVIHDDLTTSCFLPFPLRTRTRPPVVSSQLDPALAEKSQAVCVVTDIYHGMEGVERGDVKYIRVMEQIPRPWSARRRWGPRVLGKHLGLHRQGDSYDGQHAVISKDTHMGLKVQHGVVPVEDDGSAHFLVPGDRNIFFQALDENYMALQSERTYVNYRSGERRSCIGCHEMPADAPSVRQHGKLKALQRGPSVPGPQPGERTGRRAIDFVADVQPILDQHCISCHAAPEPAGGLNLSGTMTELFSVAYEELIEKRDEGSLGRQKDEPLLIGPTVGENHPKIGNVKYMPPRTFGSHASILLAMLEPDMVTLEDPEQASLAARLREIHEEEGIKLTPEERIKLSTWIDSNAQFYGMYWGRRSIEFKDHPNFRPAPTFEAAISKQSPIPEEER